MGTTTDIRWDREIMYTTLCKGGNCEAPVVIVPPPSCCVLHPSDSNPRRSYFPHTGVDYVAAHFLRVTVRTPTKAIPVVAASDMEVVPFERLTVQSELRRIHIAHRNTAYVKLVSSIATLCAVVTHSSITKLGDQ